MRQVQASEAMSHLPTLLDEVEKGETVIITRHGRAIARIVPETLRMQQVVESALDNIVARRSQAGPVSTEDLLSARDEGRK